MAQGRLQLRLTEPVTVTEQPPWADPLVRPGEFAVTLMWYLRAGSGRAFVPARS